MSVTTTGNPYNQRFTIVPNYLIRKLAVSFEARMMLIYLMSHDEGYRLRVAQVQAETGRSKDTVQKLMRELEEIGVLGRRRIHGSNGRILGTTYEIIHSKLLNLCAEYVGDPPNVPDDPSDGDSVRGPDQEELPFPQVSPETVLPAQVDSPTKKTIFKKTKEQEEELPPPAAQPSPTVVVDAEVINDEPAMEMNAGRMVAALVDWGRERDILLPKRTIGMYAKKFKELLDQGIPQDRIGRALMAMAHDNKICYPSQLDVYVVKIQQSGPPKSDFRRDVRTNQQVRNEHMDDRMTKIKTILAAWGTTIDNNKATKKAVALLKEHGDNVQALLAGGMITREITA